MASSENKGPNFVAIDFETADSGADSACAVGLVKVTNGRIVETQVRLIRPPRSLFLFSHIHGIYWNDVASKPTFGNLWPTLEPLLRGADFLAAHNASFDKRVLAACCAAAGLPVPPLPFVCTVKLARDTWDLRPTKLSDVAAHLNIALNHHEALSDASACARIVLAAHAQGAKLEVPA